MDYNLLNGGLVLKAQDKLIISDIKRLTTVIDFIETEGMCWFMNFAEEGLFYSDQKRQNALCKMELQGNPSAALLLSQPCYGLCLNGEWLYYLNENDRRLYRCLTNGKSESRIIGEPINSFLLAAGEIYYTTAQGIWRCSETGKGKEAVCDAVASALLLLGEKLVFTDQNKQYQLTIFDLQTNRAESVEGMAASSINTDGRYLYCANRLNENSVYRIDPEQGKSIRICSESAEYLHVIEHDLYFCIKREWHKMSLTGGEPRKIMR